MVSGEWRVWADEVGGRVEYESLSDPLILVLRHLVADTDLVAVPATAGIGKVEYL